MNFSIAILSKNLKILMFFLLKFYKTQATEENYVRND